MRSSTVTPATLSAAPASLVYIKLIFVALFWGGTFIAGRVLAQQMPPMTAASGRFSVAVVLLLLLAWKFEGGLPRLDRKQVLTTAALGLTGFFLYNLFFLAALARMPAGRTALFVALNPIVTALASAVLLRERLGSIKWLGIVLAFCGTAIVITHGDLAGLLHGTGGGIGAGEVFMFCGISSWAAYTLIGRVALKGLSPVAATTYAAMWGLAFLLVGAAFEFPTVPWRSFGWQVWASIAYMGLFGTVIGFVWYYEGVKALGPSRTAVFNNLVPVFGILLAAALLGEPVLVSMLVGGAVTIAGVVLTNRKVM
ncbi:MULTISPECIES: DMT family transporter [unclassified Janthinobacterium]|uniref:DMT family transporter n=1 Tax=unclassified Janthinobacterium TaxID=2610881 RepID=UPI001612DEC7|nr:MULTISPECIES: DMT family transporter [unclassified Janthinobacterium]MBB5366671.1 drug/metabolite transporter (DMT)-like permease [Janthinobacterium sp. K2C7]MBB5380851.1 drug/metabolite transporter (DMT)-like permease [Janthinobacterium sp. K2Li3]MBB5385053.1 drug/metabolite transporter (DMT)-like permease [Janthinobacterium sp. K2E3]